VEIDAPSGVIGIWDEGEFSPPREPNSRDFITALRRTAQQANVFFIDAEEHIKYRIELIVDTDLPSHLREELEPRFGSFHLRVPTGRIHLAAVPVGQAQVTMSVPAGQYLVTPYARRQFEPRGDEAALQQQVGIPEVRYRNAIDRLGLVGCLGLALLAGVVALPVTRHLWAIATPLLGCPWLVYLLLTKQSRYRRIDENISAREASLPHFALVLRRSAAAAAVPGGWCVGL